MEQGLVFFASLDGASTRSVGGIRVRMPVVVCKAYGAPYGAIFSALYWRSMSAQGVPLHRHAPPAREGWRGFVCRLQEHVGAFRRVVPACDDASASNSLHKSHNGFAGSLRRRGLAGRTCTARRAARSAAA